MKSRLIFLSISMGLAGAAVMPVLSTHLAVNLAIEPIWIGILFASNTLSGVAASHWLAKHSDQGLSRVRIVRACLILSIIGVVGLGLTHQYWLLLIAGIVMFGAISPIQPQVFALAREQIQDDSATLYQSVLRATMSLSWIVGPPVAYILFDQIGFFGLTIICAVMFVFAWFTTSHLEDSPLSVRPAVQPIVDGRLKWLVLAVAAVFAANNMYIVYMPIFIYETLPSVKVLPGLLMGLAAGLEIPLMIGAGAYANRWRLFSPLKLAAACGVVFYFVLYFFHNLPTLIVIQIFNAMFIGVTAGLGISVFQTLMEGRMGMASTLYSNAIKMGGLAGALGGGVIAQFLGPLGVFIACGVMSVVAYAALHIASQRKWSFS